MNQYFFDGLGNITVIGGTVRLDFVTFSPTETDANGRPQAVPAQRAVLSIEGFVRATEKMQETVQTLSKLMQASREQAQAGSPKPAHDKSANDPAQASPPNIAPKPPLFP